MPIVSFANPKGGAGKTTAALLLSTQLADQGLAVTIIDADPERWISKWSELPGKPDLITIVSDVSQDTILDEIDDAATKTPFVVVDLEGTANTLVGYAVSLSDLVIIPTQGSSMDARGGAKTVQLIRQQERISRQRIPYSVLLTRMSAAVTSRAAKNVQKQLAAAEIDVLGTHLIERAAYRDLFDYGGTLSTLNPTQVGNLNKAITNADAFVSEVLERLKANDQQGRGE